MVRDWLRGLVFVALAGALPASAAGQDVSARTYVTPGTTVEAGGPFVLNLEVTGTQSFERDPAPPDLSSFARYLGSGTQSAVQVVNGSTTVSFTVQYRFQALSEGTYTIPPVTVEAAGQTLTTEEIRLQVAPEGTEGGGDDLGLSPEDLFITAEATSTSVLEGEPFVVEYRIWTRVDVSNFGMTSVPEPQGFWVEDITPAGQPRVEQLTRDGQRYASAVIRRVALVATGPGLRMLEPIALEAQVRVRGGRDPFDNFFGRASPFGSVAVPTTVQSNTLSIDVQPLPEGRPDDFTGIVGALSLAADLDRDSVPSNEAVTLTVEVSADGNIRSLPPPSLELPEDFEVFPPEVSEAVTPTAQGLRGTKTFEYVLIPRAPGLREIPPLRLAYFDTESNAYRVAESDPLPLAVSGTLVDDASGLARGGVEQLREDIRFIRLGPLGLQPVGGSLFGTSTFWLFLLLPLVAAAGAVALRRHQDLLEGDVAYARGRRAGRVARKRLAEARRLAEAGDTRRFYAEVARSLRGLAADRMNLAEAGLRTDQLDEALAQAGVPDRLRTDLRACLDRCDRERFAPSEADSGARERFLSTAEDLMGALDKAVR